MACSSGSHSFVRRMQLNYFGPPSFPCLSDDVMNAPSASNSPASSQSYCNSNTDGGPHTKSEQAPIVLCSQEKVHFLKKCCASPILRFILHLLSDPRQETLCSWYGGPFGVKIWNTRKFTECYNAAMGTKMNFTNVSRALQACELITLAGIRLWKRIRQGEYSFFPGYTGHGLPQIPPSAMPRDVPAQFPFERRGIVKGMQPRCSPAYEQPLFDGMPQIYPSIYYGQAPYASSTPEHHNDHSQLRRALSTPCATTLSPAPSVSPQVFSPTVTAIPAAYVQLPSYVLTPPPSDNSSSFSDSFSFSDSSLPLPYSPAFASPACPHPVEMSQLVTQGNADDQPAPAPKENDVQHLLDPSPTSESLALPKPTDFSATPPPCSPPPVPEPPSPPELSSSPCESFLCDYTKLGEQDIFGNTSSLPGYDLTIDETSLLYH